MPNLSQIKRQRMLAFLDKIRAEHTDDEALIAINEIETELTSRKYGLVWEEHEERVDVEMQMGIPVFTEVADREIVSDSNLPCNFLLEGDNLHGLKLLEKTHQEKIDVIYIDPPYNTGGKDFIYDDTFVDVLDGYRHSKWLSFMEKRLSIAKNLLTQNGCIFISIDDNEQAQLKVLCDDIFGSENFIATLIWAAGRKNDSKYISVSHEYILCYAKSLAYLKQEGIVWKERKQGIEDIYKVHKQLLKQYGTDFKAMSVALKQWYKSLPDNHPARNHSHYNCIDENGVYFPADISWPGGGGPKYEVLHPITQKPVRVPNRGWVYPTKERMNEIIAQNLVHFGEDETSVPCKKTYLSDNENSTPYSVFYKDGRAATKRLRALMGEAVFQNPKDEEIIKSILRFTTSKHSVILDFFAGSGTTAHSVLSLNNEDGGNRSFILCTNNENGICENITYPRIKTVITGKRNDGSEYSSGISANLKYYKTDFIPKTSADEEYCVGDELLMHIAEMVQLEYAVKLDGKNYILASTDEEADSVIADNERLKDCKAIYVSASVLLTGEQQKELIKKNIPVYVIPDCYFETELLGVGER